jgi:hypothetical protein
MLSTSPIGLPIPSPREGCHHWDKMTRGTVGPTLLLAVMFNLVPTVFNWGATIFFGVVAVNGLYAAARRGRYPGEASLASDVILIASTVLAILGVTQILMVHGVVG